MGPFRDLSSPPRGRGAVAGRLPSHRCPVIPELFQSSRRAGRVCQRWSLVGGRGPTRGRPGARGSIPYALPPPSSRAFVLRDEILPRVLQEAPLDISGHVKAPPRGSRAPYPSSAPPHPAAATRAGGAAGGGAGAVRGAESQAGRGPPSPLPWPPRVCLHPPHRCCPRPAPGLRSHRGGPPLSARPVPPSPRPPPPRRWGSRTPRLPGGTASVSSPARPDRYRSRAPAFSSWRRLPRGRPPARRPPRGASSPSRALSVRASVTRGPARSTSGSDGKVELNISLI